MTKIAQVPVALLINGQRKVFPAGSKLPELSEHDEKELLASGAIRDTAEAAQDAKAAAEARQDADAEFQAAREQIQAATASTQSPEEPKAPTGRSTKK